jgi:8-oxo-dGTP pyrophosphatase MutT (NUDIX family)
MYKIYFGKRYIILSSSNEDKNLRISHDFITCKNKKSFDKAYIEFQKDDRLSCLKLINPKPDKLFKHFKKKFKVIHAAGGLVENNEGKILVMKRDGVWDLPKGKIEKGESRKHAAIREVEEECGIFNLKIVCKIGKSYHTYKLENKSVLKLTHWYKMIYDGNALPVPETREGISEIIWTGNNELKEIKELAYPNLSQIIDFVL